MEKPSTVVLHTVTQIFAIHCVALNHLWTILFSFYAKHHFEYKNIITLTNCTYCCFTHGQISNNQTCSSDGANG